MRHHASLETVDDLDLLLGSFIVDPGTQERSNVTALLREVFKFWGCVLRRLAEVSRPAMAHNSPQIFWALLSGCLASSAGPLPEKELLRGAGRVVFTCLFYMFKKTVSVRVVAIPLAGPRVRSS